MMLSLFVSSNFLFGPTFWMGCIPAVGILKLFPLEERRNLENFGLRLKAATVFAKLRRRVRSFPSHSLRMRF
jgi:hypothetical protein